MLQLFLSEPSWRGDNAKDQESYMRITSLLDELEVAIWYLMSLGGRSESRLWLCNSISSLTSISPHHQREFFVSLLRSKPTKRYLASQLLQLIFERRPQKVGPIIAKKSQKLETFFRGNSNRILQWFSNFSGTGVLEHGKGAKALSRFAFVNRDICWEELEWKGKHGQSPAMVATKPHYFLDLDVQQTVENFLEYVPEFWSSHEFSESLKDGDILYIETGFFVNMFIDFMYGDDMKEVWKIIEDFLMEESFSFLCHHLLIVLREEDLLIFINLISKFIRPKAEFFVLGDTSTWFEVILSKYGGSSSIDQLLLLNALTIQGRKLLRLVKEEGGEEQKDNIKNLCFQLCEFSSYDNSLPLLIDKGLGRKPLDFIKWLGLQSWSMHFRMLEEFQTPESWESLFVSNGMGFRKSNKYELLHDNEFVEDCRSDWDEGPSSGFRPKKRRKQRKKRRLDLDPDLAGIYDNELLEFNLSNTTLDLQSKVGDWLLSIDDYSAAWSSVDLPEHLSKHCFLTWLKWASAKWRF